MNQPRITYDFKCDFCSYSFEFTPFGKIDFVYCPRCGKKEKLNNIE